MLKILSHLFFLYFLIFFQPDWIFLTQTTNADILAIDKNILSLELPITNFNAYPSLRADNSVQTDSNNLVNRQRQNTVYNSNHPVNNATSDSQELSMFFIIGMVINVTLLTAYIAWAIKQWVKNNNH